MLPHNIGQLNTTSIIIQSLKMDTHPAAKMSMQVVQWKVERKILNVSLQDHIKNVEIRK
jgi:hypothetical protein